MTIQSAAQFDNVTVVDVQLATAYYPLLVELARRKQCIPYGELVDLAKVTYPANAVVQKGIAVSTGRRLDVVRMFTNARQLPDLTSLVINRSTGECGVGFARSFDAQAARDAVFAFNWSLVTTDFDLFVKQTEQVLKPRKAVKEPQAREQMASYYQVNKSTLPPTIRAYRDQIIDRIKEGFSPEEAFAAALNEIAQGPAAA